jgi:type VI secretion system protein ImpL
MAPVTLEDFWEGSLRASQESTVPAAFTVRGKERIDAFFNEIEAALFDPLIIAGKKLEFIGWYKKSYMDAWHAFGAGFSLGKERLQSGEERRQVASRMGTDQGPYFALLNRMADELKPVSEGEATPSWVRLVYQFQTTKLKAQQEAALKDAGALAAATQTGKTLMTKLEKKFGKEGSGKLLESELGAAQGLNEYLGALTHISPAVVSRKAAFTLVGQTFSDDPETSTSALHGANRGVQTLTTYLGGGETGQKMFWALVKGPLDYLWSFLRMEAACHLQELWEKEVLVELQGVRDQKMLNDLLLGDEGYATKYAKNVAAPFLERSLKKGYVAKKVLGETIPFENAFLSFLTKGAQSAKPVQGHYEVTIQGLPTDTNNDSSTKAHATRLEVQCAAGSTTLVNLNYPVSKVIKWSPQDCGDVLFEIEAGQLVLSKKYSGPYAFAEFLKDFSQGQRTFYPDDFPDKKNEMNRLGIKFIKAKYRFNGHSEVVGLLEVSPGRAPKDIVLCWDR